MLGERIRQARLAAGLTLDALAARMESLGQPITKAGLSKYERGKSKPPQVFLAQLGRALGVRATYFVSEPKVTIQWLTQVGPSGVKPTFRDRLRALANRVVEMQLWLQGTLYPLAKPRFPAPKSVCSFDEAENVAATLRRRWRVEDLPIKSVTMLAEDHGAVVVGFRQRNTRVEGFSGWANRTVPVPLVNLTIPEDERRFSVAHEIGHLVLLFPKHVQPEDREQFIDRFAAALIVPPSIARQELGVKRRRLGIEELGLLKRKHGLTMHGWARRALELNIIELSAYKTLHSQLASSGWNRVEPITFPCIEQPTRLNQMILHALAEGIVSMDRVAEFLPISWIDMAGEGSRMPHQRPSATELRKLPPEQRRAILEAAAKDAENEYCSNRDLTDFEAFSEEELDGH
jgi:Zn-dependent peptidase ImmA (M78 family)/transcriptional regulator with XRE-family HTH domain